MSLCARVSDSGRQRTIRSRAAVAAASAYVYQRGCVSIAERSRAFSLSLRVDGRRHNHERERERTRHSALTRFTHSFFLDTGRAQCAVVAHGTKGATCSSSSKTTKTHTNTVAAAVKKTGTRSHQSPTRRGSLLPTGAPIAQPPSSRDRGFSRVHFASSRSQFRAPIFAFISFFSKGDGVSRAIHYADAVDWQITTDADFTALVRRSRQVAHAATVKTSPQPV